MKKFAVVLALVLVCSLTLSGCALVRLFDSDYDYDDYGSDYYYDDYDYDYDDDDYDYDYDYDDDYSYVTISDFDGFWERESSYAKYGIFVNDGTLTLFLAKPYEQYTFDDSATFTIKKVGSSFFLYIGGSKKGEIEYYSDSIYLSGIDGFSGFYDEVYSLDVDLD